MSELVATLKVSVVDDGLVDPRELLGFLRVEAGDAGQFDRAADTSGQFVLLLDNQAGGLGADGAGTKQAYANRGFVCREPIQGPSLNESISISHAYFTDLNFRQQDRKVLIKAGRSFSYYDGFGRTLQTVRRSCRETAIVDHSLTSEVE